MTETKETLNKDLLIEKFVEIFKNTHEKNFGTLGKVNVTYNPAILDVALSEIPEDRRIGWESGEGYFEVNHVQKHLDGAIGFVLEKIEDRFEFFVTTYFQATLGDAKFSHEEGLNHPLALSWVRFLSKQEDWLEAEVIENLSKGCAWPSCLSVEDGFKLLDKWIDWLEKYVL